MPKWIVWARQLPKRLLRHILPSRMNGGELRQLIDERGLLYGHVAKRAGLRPNHLSKILNKPDVSTSELERIAKAIDLKPGDLLETTCGELRRLLPIIEVLHSFDEAALPHVMRALEALRAVTNISGRKEIEGGNALASGTTIADLNKSGDTLDEFSLQGTPTVPPRGQRGRTEQGSRGRHHRKA